MTVTTTEISDGVVLADRYHVRGRLGQGGMATVFLAEDRVLCRDVAIKRLRTTGSDADARRFTREARIGASLVHPNLVTIFDSITGEDGLLIVMEYVQGRPLSHLMSANGMDPRRLLEVLRPVASALDYAHENGVVHRDVKPANIIVRTDRGVKLVDLGTATAGARTQITAEHEIVGTLSYIAPERLAGESIGEPASDVYALAVCAYEGLTGHKPHSADTPAELLARVVEGPPPDLADSPELSPGLRRVLAQGLAAEPRDRQASAGALIRDLESVIGAGVQTSTRPVAAPPTPPAAQPALAREPEEHLPDGPVPPSLTRSRRRWLAPALAGVGVLAAIGLGVAILGGDDGGGDPATGESRNAGREQAADAGGSAVAASDPAAAGESDTAVAPSGSDGAALNDQGYALIQQGRYEEAVPVLREAVAAFPEGTTDINYAYALFNLGHALRMSGQPEEAIPILEERLEIPDQTETVQAELDAARAAAGE